MKLVIGMPDLAHEAAAEGEFIRLAPHVSSHPCDDSRSVLQVGIGDIPTYILTSDVSDGQSISTSLDGTRFKVLGSAADYAGLGCVGQLLSECPLLIADCECSAGDETCGIASFKAQFPRGRIVVVMRSFCSQIVSWALKGWADGYLTLDLSPREIEAYLHLTMLGQKFVSGGAIDLLRETVKIWDVPAPKPPERPWDGVERRSKKGLTFREVAILRLLMDGKSDKQIAAECDIKIETVKFHVRSIREKIRAENRTQAAIWASQHITRVERRMAEVTDKRRSARASKDA